MSKDLHTIWMNRAANLAWKGARQVFPNPMVGAVLVKNGEIIGEGYHSEFGAPHAEIEAIKNTKNSKGATLYVTLEPCCHHGKTPPCTDAILKAGIKEIFYAQKDPNPLVAGQGAQILQAKLLQTDETRALNSLYLAQTKRRPFVHLKQAVTLDNYLAITPLTNKLSNQKTHILRAQYDAILVGINTVLSDNPKLTVRHTNGENPIRIVLDTHSRLPQNAALLKEPGKTIVITAKTHQTDSNGQIDLKNLLQDLYNQGIGSILVEGGATISQNFLNENLVDLMTVIYTPYLNTKNSNKLPPLPAATHRTAQLINDNLWLTLYLTC